MPPAVTQNPMLSVEVEPSPSLIIAGFTAAGRAIHDTRAELEAAVRTVAIPAFGNNFDVGGIPPWTPLADATIARRRSRGTGQQILVESGQLRAIATSMKPWDFSDTEATMMASQLGEADYGLYHETGTRFMPQRVWSNIQPSDEDRIAEIFEASVAAKFMFYSIVGITAGVSIIAGAAGAIGGIINRITGR